MSLNERVVELLKKVKSTADFGYVKFDSINATNELGDNALHCVCVWGDLEAAKLLVENGINVNQQGELGFTPLRVAVDFGHNSITEYLKANGADSAAVDAPEKFDAEKNSLHFLRLGEEIEALEGLLEKECNYAQQSVPADPPSAGL
ncbi:MAG: ankyrin repeat domain-containing protein [Gallionella sp.]|nr:ankyrin repeat domain-containing protein [Gallionella sp.]MDD4947642.1 ankyrin repeat domain-containing protein [Gallionella sp.]